MSERLKARIKATGPKKILALDGGGIRGMITIEVLAEMENLLRQQFKRGPEFRLAHFFDFVVGTSTGAIIAACISSGMAVSEIREFYERSGKEMFDKSFCSMSANGSGRNMAMRSSRNSYKRCLRRTRPWGATSFRLC